MSQLNVSSSVNVQFLLGLPSCRCYWSRPSPRGSSRSTIWGCSSWMGTRSVRKCAAVPGEDWDIIYHTWKGNADPASVSDALLFIADKFGNVDDSFTGGTTKDKIDLPSWKWTDQIRPGQNELVNAYAAVYPDTATGDTIIYFGADRFDTSGDANLGFWFYQDQVDAVPGSPAGSFTGQHRVGDIFVLSTFTKGGDISTIQVYRVGRRYDAD